MNTLLEATPTIVERVAEWDWAGLTPKIDEAGYVKTPVLLSAAECRALVELYPKDKPFRSCVDMAQYRFGAGEYKYFGYPLPPLVEELRQTLYARLVPLANGWMGRLGKERIYPTALSEFLADCHAGGQLRPTPLVLRYEAGGYNCLHQDLYGDLAFPLQVVFVLNTKEVDYTGGELLLVEQRPRAQSRGQVITLEQGQGLIFSNSFRPVAGGRGDYRVNVKHGVSSLTSGVRFSLGLIFHDAA